MRLPKRYTKKTWSVPQFSLRPNVLHSPALGPPCTEVQHSTELDAGQTLGLVHLFGSRSCLPYRGISPLMQNANYYYIPLRLDEINGIREAFAKGSANVLVHIRI